MRKKKRRAQKVIVVSLVGFLIASLSVFLLPLSGVGGMFQMNPGGLLVGICFWVGMLLGIGMFVLAWFLVRQNNGYRNIRDASRPGCLTAGASKFAVAADGVFLVALLVVVLANTVVPMHDGIVLAAMFLTLFAFCLRLVLNGRVFRYLCSETKRKEIEHES